MANEWLEKTYKKQLSFPSYLGMKAELRFYEQCRREFHLTVAGDMGEHADFSGLYGREATRFDVTTNLDFKKFSDYEPYMGDGVAYKIALLDQDNFEIIDVFDLAFPRCQFCGNHLIPCITLLNQNFNRHGESQWSNDQLLIDVCTGCNEVVEKHRYTHHGLFSPQEYFNNLDSSQDHEETVKSTEEYCVDTYKYFRREFDDHLMAVAQHTYKVTDHDGGGYWAIDFSFKNKAIADALPEDIECSHEL